MTQRLWVVELLTKYSKRWEPTVGVGLSREDGREELIKWQANHPTYKLRLRCYFGRGAKG